MKKTMGIISCIWLLLVGVSFTWNYREASREKEFTALQTARSFFDQILMTRQWNAGHGGVYVPITDQTQPNPYLVDPLREIKVNEHLTLTKLNPSYMTRQIGEIAARQKGVQFHITSLRPIRPENRPTPRETLALEAFERGTPEVGAYVKDETDTAFFYMAPLRTEKACLACHAMQGYQEDDIRGGISITLPFLKKPQLLALRLAHLAIGLVGLLGILITGTKLSRSYEAIKLQAAFDALTEIPNRRSFSEELLREFRRSKRDRYPLSLIMCDVDNFKLYNDTYGHGKGDDCLIAVAQGIEKTISRAGDFCARYGGEEFVVILPDTGANGASHLAEKIRSNVQAMGIAHAKSLPLRLVTVSLGIATISDGMETTHEELVNQADQALYRAKEKGRNRVEVFGGVA